MSTVTDEEIEAVAATAKPFALVQLRWAEGRHRDDADAIEREHQRRMVSMRADGTIAVLCPVLTDDLCGVAIMAETVERAIEIMADDPCVTARMMSVTVLPCVAFPGDVVPSPE